MSLGAVQKRRRLALTDLALAHRVKQVSGGHFLELPPDAFGEGRDRSMTIVEILTLMAFFVSLLTLIVTLVHVTFDITFRMLESRNKKDDKKKK